MRLRCLSLDPYLRHLSVIDREKGKQLEFGTPADKPHRPSRNLSAKVILPELFAQVEVWEWPGSTGAANGSCGIVTFTRILRENARRRHVSRRSSHGIPPVHSCRSELSHCSA